MVPNPACGQLKRELDFSTSMFAPDNLVTLDRFSVVPSRVSPPIGALTHALCCYLFPLSSTVVVSICSVEHHWISPEFIRSRNYCMIDKC